MVHWRENKGPVLVWSRCRKPAFLQLKETKGNFRVMYKYQAHASRQIGRRAVLPLVAD